MARPPLLHLEIAFRQAERSLAEFVRAFPNVTIEQVRSGRPYRANLLDHIAEGLEGVGMPHRRGVISRSQSGRESLSAVDDFHDRRSSCLQCVLQSRTSAPVKSFGRRLAYETLRGTNPRAADDGLWVFQFSAEPNEVTTGSGKRGT